MENGKEVIMEKKLLLLAMFFFLLSEVSGMEANFWKVDSLTVYPNPATTSVKIDF